MAGMQINVDAFDDLDKKISQVYGNLVKLDTKLDAGVVKRFYDLARGVNQFTNAIIKLGEVASNDLKTATARIKTLFQDVQSLDKIVSAAGKLNGESIIKFSNAIYRFSLSMKEAGQIVLTSNPLSNLTSAIKQFVKDFAVTKDLSKVEKALDTFAGILKKMYSVFSKISTGPPLDLAGIKAIMSFYKSFQNTLTKTAPSNMAAVEADLATFGSIIRKLASTLEKVSASPINVAGLTPLLGFYKAFLASINSTGAPGQMAALSKDFGEFFKVINSIMRSVSNLKIDPAQFGALQSGIKDLIELYNSFQTAFTAAPGTGPAAGPSASKQISTQIDDFKSIIREILSIIKIIPTSKIDTSQLKRLQEAFLEIMKFYQQFAEIVSKQADDSTATLTAKLLNGLGSILQGIGAFFASRSSKGLIGSITDLIVFRLALSQAVTIMRSIIDIVAGLDNVRIDAIAKFAKGMGAVFTGLAEFFRVIVNGNLFNFSITTFIQKIIQIRLGLIPLGMVLDKLRPLFKNASEGDVSAVSSFTKAVAAIFNAISSLFEIFAKRENGANFGTIGKVWLALQVTLKPVINVLKQLKQLPKGISFVGVDTLFDGLGRFIETVSKLASNPIDTKSLKAQLKAIGEVLQFKGFKNLSKDSKALTATAAIITSMAGLFDALGRLQDVNLASLSGLKNVDFSWLSNLTKEFAKASSFLRNIDDKEIAKLDTVYKSLSLLQNIDKLQGGGASGGTGNLESTIKKGILGAYLQINLFNTAIKATIGLLKLLNPANVVAFFGAVANLAGSAVQKVKDAFSSIEQLGSSVKSFGQSLISDFGIGKITGSAAFASSVEFDKLGSSLEVFGGLTKEQRKNAEEFANVLGKDYPLSANEALKATLDLVKAGQSFDSAQSILPAAADLATLSDSGSIENATSFIIQATSAFRDFNNTTKATYENASTAVNIISAAADSSTATVEGLADGLKSVGPVAAGFGLSLEETTAALALFTDGGLQGAEAGTQLKSILTNLTTDTAKKELRRLGVQLSDTAGNIRPLNDILNDIQKKFTQTGTVVYTVSKKLAGPDADRLKIAQQALAAATRQEYLIGNDLNATGLGKNADKKLNEARTIAENATAIITQLAGSTGEAQRITANIKRTELQNAESLKKIAGSYGQAGLAILLAQGQDGLQKFIDKMDAVAPASVRAKQALDNISGDIIQLQGSVETLTTKALVPLLEKFFRPFVKIGRLFVDSLLQIDDRVIEFVSTAIALGSSLLTAVGGFALITGAIIELGGAFGGLLLSLSSTFSIGVIGAIAGLAAGLVTLAAAFATIVPFLGVITAAFETFYEVFSTDAGGAATQFKDLGEIVGKTIGNISSALRDIVTFVSDVLGGSVAGSLETVGSKFAAFFGNLYTKVLLFNTTGAGRTLKDIGELFKGFSKTLSYTSELDKAGEDVTNFMDAVGGGFSGSAASKAKKARDDFTKQYGEFIHSIVINNEFLKGLFGGKLTAEDVTFYLDTAVTYVAKIRAGVSEVIGSFGKAFKSASAAFNVANGSLGAAITTFVSDLSSNLDSSLGHLSGTILHALAVLFNIKTEDLATVFNTDGFAAGISRLIVDAIGLVKNYLITNRDSIKSLMVFLFENLALGAVSAAKNFAQFLGFDGIAKALDVVLNGLRKIFGNLVDTIFNVLQGDSITHALLKAFGPGLRPFLALAKTLGDTVELIVQSFTLLFNTIFGNKEGEVSSNSILDSVNSMITSLTKFVRFVNDNFLSFFAKGDFAGLFKNIGSLMLKAARSAFTALINYIYNIDFRGIWNSVVAGLRSGFRSVISFLTNLDFSKILGSVGSALKYGLKTITDYIKSFTNLSDIGDGLKNFDLTKLVANVINQIPEVLKKIGPALLSIGTFFFKHFQSIFDFTQGDFLSSFMNEFDIYSFIKHIRGLILRVVNGVIKFLRANGGEVKTFLVKFFASFVTSGLSFLQTLADIFGLQDISKFFGTVISTIENTIGGVLDVITKILGGENASSAVTDIFGSQLKAIGDFVNNLVEILKNGIKFVQDFVTALFAPGPNGGASPVETAIKAVQDALSSVLDFVQNSFLAPLLAGDVSGAFKNLGTAVSNLVTGLAAAIKSELDKLDLGTKFNEAAHSLLDGFMSAFGDLLTGFADFVGFDASAFLSNIDRTLSAAIDGVTSGDANNLFTAVGATIINSIIAAIGLGVSAITELTGFDASNFLAGLDTIINNNIKAIGDGGGLFELVVGTISGLLSTALGGLFDGLGALLDIDPDKAFKTISDALTNFSDTLSKIFTGKDDKSSLLENLGLIIQHLADAFKTLFDTFQSSGAQKSLENIFQVILEFAANLVASAINTAGDFLKGIDDFIQILANVDAAQLTLIGLGLGVLALQLAGISVLTALPAILTAVVGFFYAMAFGTGAEKLVVIADGMSTLYIQLAKFASLTGLSSVATYFSDILATAYLYGTKEAFFQVIGDGFIIMKNGWNLFANSIIGKAAAILVIFEAIRAVAQNVKILGRAFRDLSHLDIGKFLGDAVSGLLNFGVDLGFNLLELLGIDKVFGQTRQQLKLTADRFGLLFGFVFDQLGVAFRTVVLDPIDYLLNVSIPLLLSNLNEIKIRAAAALGDSSAQGALTGLDFADSLKFGKDGFTGNQYDDSGNQVFNPDGSPMQGQLWTAGMIDGLTKAGPDAIKRAQLNAHAGFKDISKTFISEMQRTDLSAEDQALFLSQNVGAFNFLDILGQQLADVAKSGNTNLLQAMIEESIKQQIVITPEMQRQIGANISAGFRLGDGAGATARIDALNVTIGQLQTAGLDATELIKVRDALQKQIDDFMKLGNGEDDGGVTVTTDVNAQVGDTTVKKDDVQTGVADAVTGAIPADGVAVDVKVKPRLQFLPSADGSTPTTAVDQLQGALNTSGFGFDLSTLTDPAKVGDFDTLVQNLTDDVVSLAQQLNGLPATQAIVTTALADIQTTVTTFRDLTVPMFGEVQLAIDPVRSTIEAINAGFLLLFATVALGLPIMTLEITAASLIIVGQFSIMQTAATTTLQTVVTKVRELAGAFKDAATAATNLSTNPAFKAGGGGGSGSGSGDNGGGGGTPVGGGRASGGSVFPGLIYPFLEKGLPELVLVGSKTFLATPKPGTVVPMKPAATASAAPNLASNRSTGTYGGATAKTVAPSSTNTSNSVTIVEGAISVQISAANVTNQAQLVDKIVKAVSADQAKRNQKLSDRLRTSHR